VIQGATSDGVLVASRRTVIPLAMGLSFKPRADLVLFSTEPASDGGGAVAMADIGPTWAASQVPGAV
jgi:hypothetical protein